MSHAKNAFIAVLVTAFVVVGGVSVQAQESSEDTSTTTDDLRAQIESLQQQVNELRAQLDDQTEEAEEDDEEENQDEEQEEADDENEERPDHAPPTPGSPADADSAQAFACTQMHRGERSETVRQLQEFLSNSEDIYPEGLTTGYYGQLTSQAVKRLHDRIGVSSDGETVGPATFDKVQELIDEGAGDSGIVPPGLLHAPGIQCRQQTSTSSSATSSEDEDQATTSGLDVENLPINADLKERLQGVLESVFGNDSNNRGDSQGSSQRPSSAGQ